MTSRRPRNRVRLVCSILLFPPLLCCQVKDDPQKKTAEERKATGPKKPGDQQKPANQPTAADREKALDTLKRLVTDSNYRELGFDSVADAANATQGDPFRRYIITAGELTAFKDTDNPASAIREGGELLIPVSSGGKVRCFITMADRGKGWRGVSFGMAAVAQALTSARTKQSDARHLLAGSFFALDVVPLAMYVLGWRSDGKLPPDTGNADIFFYSPVPNRKMPADAQPAIQFLKIFRDEVRKQQPGAPGAGR